MRFAKTCLPAGRIVTEKILIRAESDISQFFSNLLITYRYFYAILYCSESAFLVYVST